MNRAEPIEINTQESCFHCGEVVPAGSDYTLEIDGALQPMCCPGCRAVAGMITANGLARFYQQRTAYSTRPSPDSPPQSDAFITYDDPALQAQFCSRDASGFVDARLLIGGVTCAACTWLIESSLRQIEGINAATLNLTQNRLDVRFDSRRVALSDVFGQLTDLGYSVRPWQSSALQEQARTEYRRDLRRLAVAGIGMMQVGMFAIALHAGELQGMSERYEQLLRLVSLLVTTFIVLFSAREFFESAARHLRHGVLVMDLPVALAIGLAFSASVIATLRGDGAVYFDSVVMFTFLLLLARFVEKRLRFRDALELQDAEHGLPDIVQVWRDEKWTASARRTVVAGDRILLRGGETVPIDGIVQTGGSAVREDTFSGEALPRRVGPGDAVFAGTLNLDASLEINATGSYADSRLAALQQSIDNARHGKPALARLADRIAGYFIAGVLLATTLTAVLWWQHAPESAFWVALSVLVISCPCALSLATPATLANAATLMRKRGVIVRSETGLEALTRATHFIFDKTGTLTTGGFSIATIVPLDDGIDDRAVKDIGASLQRHSNHPVATAFAGIRGDESVTEIAYRVGAGLEGRQEHTTLRMGSLSFCRELAPSFPDEPDDTHYWIALCREAAPLAWIGLSDQTRAETPDVLDQLHRAGMQIELLTGDASARTQRLAASLPFSRVSTGQSPDQKQDRVAELQAQGAVVAMVGDGLNDAPVLQRADVSIAVAGATDLARAQADFVILEGSLMQVIALRRIALRTRRIIGQNMLWALSYNLLGIPLAAMGLIAPWAAAVGMSASSLLVVANATRVRRMPVQ